MLISKEDAKERWHPLSLGDSDVSFHNLFGGARGVTPRTAATL
jgi:hypothetical protein